MSWQKRFDKKREKDGLDWSRRFNKKFVSQPDGDMWQTTSREELKQFISKEIKSALREMAKEVIPEQDINSWLYSNHGWTDSYQNLTKRAKIIFDQIQSNIQKYIKENDGL